MFFSQYVEFYFIDESFKLQMQARELKVVPLKEFFIMLLTMSKDVRQIFSLLLGY